MMHKINVLLNLVPIKSGGGQQVGFNFLYNLVHNNYENYDFHVLASKNTFISDFLENQNKLSYDLFNDSIFNRIILLNKLKREIIEKNHIDLIYTLFGPALVYKKTINVAGVAYSNLFFPSIDFWKGNLFFLLKKKIIDWYRLNSLLKADALIFENKSMLEQARKIFKVKELTFIPPSISKTKPNYKLSSEMRSKLEKLNFNCFNILMLTGWHPNKNINLIPEVLLELKSLGFEDVNFVLSLDKKDKNVQYLIERSINIKVIDNIHFIGAVNTEDVRGVVEKVDALILISLLESFSNNIIEAWTYKKPLIITNAMWSISICNQAALYVDRNNPKDIAQKIVTLKDDKNLYFQLIDSGLNELANYPSPEQKVLLQLQYLQEIYERKNKTVFDR